MQIPRNELIRWLMRTFQFDSGEYREMLRIRLEDLANRNIADDALEMYLKSGGWNPEIAEVYRAFMDYLNNTKEEETMGDDMISKAKAKQALRQMLRELGDSCGYKFDDTADLSEVRNQFSLYLRSLAATASLEPTHDNVGVDSDEVALALTYLKQAETTLAAALSAR